MASLVLTVGGSALGNALLPGIGGAFLGGIGAYFGGQIDNAIFGTSHIRGPRLENLKVQDSTYGKGMPVLYGNIRVAGNVIWSSDLIETLSTDSVGGKGGGSGASVERASYAVDCAVAIGLNPLTGAKQGLRTIWADSKIIYQNGAWQDGIITDAEFYAGDNTQIPSPLMESYLGSGNVPAYRGLIYLVLHRLQLASFGNRIPNLTFEIAPEDATIAPMFLGEYNSGLLSKPDTLFSPNAMPAIPVLRSGSSVSRFLIGGVTQSGSTYQFTVAEIDVTGNAPVEIARYSSASVTRTNPFNDLAWGLSRDGKRIACYMLHTDTGNPVTLAIFDIASRSFGAVVTDYFSFPAAHNQLAWLDEQRFVLPDTLGTEYGVRVYAASGLTPVPLGFFGVWGSGSASSRSILPFALFGELAGGLSMLIADGAFTPTTIYARSLQWQNSGLVVGAEAVLSSSLGGFASSQAALLPLGNHEFVLVRISTSQMQLMSFFASYAGVTITRGVTTISYSPAGNCTVNLKDRKLCFVSEGASTSSYCYGEIALTATGFSVSSASAAVSGSYTGTKNYFTPYAVDGSRILLLATGGSGTLSRAALISRASNGQGLDTITSDILTRAGYSGSDVNVTALSGIMLQGYQLDGPMTARAALEPLQAYQGFDLVEKDGQLVAKLYSAAVDKALSSQEARAAQEHQELPPIREVTRAQELDLPREVNVDYLDPAHDFQLGTQRARRITGQATAIQNMHLPVVCTAQKAKQIAEITLYRNWSERSQTEAQLSRAYMDIDVGDVISLDGETLRIISINQQGGLQKISAVPVSTAALDSAAAADSSIGLSRHAIETVDSTAFLMDIPLLRSADDQPGYYVCISGRTGWPGASLLRSGDGVNFTTQGSFSLPATAGMATTALAASQPYYMDRANTVTVALLQGNLASCTIDNLMNGGNAALLGDEIIQFQNATLNSDGSYTLANLLRGRKGTENNLVGHSVGDRFVLLQTNTLRFMPLGSSDRGRRFYFRAASIGQDASDIANTGFTPQLKMLQPLAPTHLQASRNGGGDVTLQWKRRARRDSEWVDLIDVPLDEVTELYDVEVMNGANVARTFASVSSPTVSYTAAQQLTDFGATQSAIAFRIYQLSSRYGRGMTASATL